LKVNVHDNNSFRRSPASLSQQQSSQRAILPVDSSVSVPSNRFPYHASRTVVETAYLHPAFSQVFQVERPSLYTTRLSKPPSWLHSQLTLPPPPVHSEVLVSGSTAECTRNLRNRASRRRTKGHWKHQIGSIVARHRRLLSTHASPRNRHRLQPPWKLFIIQRTPRRGRAECDLTTVYTEPASVMGIAV